MSMAASALAASLFHSRRFNGQALVPSNQQIECV
jgi:hypothetical protein